MYEGAIGRRCALAGCRCALAGSWPPVLSLIYIAAVVLNLFDRKLIYVCACVDSSGFGDVSGYVAKVKTALPCTQELTFHLICVG